MYEHYLVVYCLAAFITDGKNRLLIVKKSAQEQIDAGKWVVPGGKVKADEHVIAALKREVREEVGLDIFNSVWVGEDVFKVGDKYFHAAHFFCKVKSAGGIKLETKLLEFRWIGLKDLENYNIPAGIKTELVNVFANYLK